MLPNSYADITVAQMLEISQAKNSMKDIKAILDLFIDTDELEFEDFIEASVELTNVLQSAPKVVPCDSYIIDGVKFTLNHVEDLNVNAYVDFDELSKDKITNLPLLLGIIYSSDKDKGDYVEDLKARSRLLLNMDFETASSALVFFSKNFLEYTNNFLDSLEKTHPQLRNQITQTRQALGGMKSSLENLDGTSQSGEKSGK